MTIDGMTITEWSAKLHPPERAANFLGLRVQTLARWRTERSNRLPYRKIGRMVRYQGADIIAYAEGQRRSSTSDNGVAA